MNATTSGVAVASVEVLGGAPETFVMFTEGTASWWRPGPPYRSGDRRQTRLRIERRVGGRLVELSGPADFDGDEIARVLVWEPGRRVVLVWRGAITDGWPPTDVEIRFVDLGGITRVTLEHGGWDDPRLPDLSGDYQRYWSESLAAFADRATFPVV